MGWTYNTVNPDASTNAPNYRGGGNHLYDYFFYCGLFAHVCEDSDESQARAGRDLSDRRIPIRLRPIGFHVV